MVVKGRWMIAGVRLRQWRDEGRAVKGLRCPTRTRGVESEAKGRRVRRRALMLVSSVR